MCKIAGLPSRDLCSGCGLCAYVCRRGAIKMEYDEEGFLYPLAVEDGSCCECGLCISKCPVLKAESNCNPIGWCYAGHYRQDDDIRKSASGGLCHALMKGSMERGDAVYGVSYTDAFDGATFIKVTTADLLEKIRGSKYIQADKQNLYSSIIEARRASDSIFFFGLPCEVAAVKNLIQEDENIVTCSLICHGPTSVKVHSEYVANLEERVGAKINDFSVRDKKDGWKPYYIHALFENGDEHYERFDESEYGKAFIHFKRPSCSNCVFKEERDVADITVGDYHFAYGNPSASQYNRLGVSVALARTNKGKALLDSIDGDFSLAEIDERGALMNQAIHEPIPKSPFRSAFSNSFLRSGLHAAANNPAIRLGEFMRTAKISVMSSLVRMRNALFRK